MAHNPSHNTNLVAQANQFRNRRTGQLVPQGTLYHLHPEQGPMEGAIHNPNISGGSAGHDYFDAVSNVRTTTTRMRTNGRNNMSYRRRGASRRGVNRRRGVARRRGAATHQPGHSQSCPPGMMMQNGVCVSAGTYSNTGSGYGRRSRVSRVASRRRGAQSHVEYTHMSSAGVAYHCPPGQSYLASNCVPVSTSPYGRRTY